MALLQTWRRSSFLVLVMMYPGHLVSTPVLSAVVVLTTTLSSADNACCGSTRSSMASLSDCWPIQTMSSIGVVAGHCPSMAKLWLKCMYAKGTMLDVEATFCCLGDMACSGGDSGSAIAARFCVAWEMVQETLACPDQQIPLTLDKQQANKMY